MSGLEDPGTTIVQLKLDDRDTYDYLVKGGMSSGNTLDVATVDDPQCSRPVVAIGFVSMTASGREERSQFSMHVAQFQQIAAALRGAHPREG